ncbi:hypothetical protein QBC33DRAFT_552587 [Phialemonium atrogriseum]|uniref:DUF5672 domain-containing protein n=1 Tax=Phialemonium atrogriseum TaxID=1093897 RepID=A0AAJ0BSF5_9PEZI|nr:uncharacterized protein QBC33DRAFT_552587 [Phialemonium atrogriseum]KAK1762187.1 hypothetical protein QBC33DRAFT_552587 [Phialemonium atrogriseum]
MAGPTQGSPATRIIPRHSYFFLFLLLVATWTLASFFSRSYVAASVVQNVRLPHPRLQRDTDLFQDASQSQIPPMPETEQPDQRSKPQNSPMPNSHLYAPGSLPSNARRLAVIIETNITSRLMPIMLHFANVLGPTWTVVLFTLEENWVMPSSALFLRAAAERRVETRFLPPGTDLSSSPLVSLFLTKPWLWEQVEWADRILLFQLDSIICSSAAVTVDDFARYDFIGAPIDPQYGEGYNGGLSLRNPRLFLQITKEADFETSPFDYEDSWFYAQAKARAGVLLPTEDVAKTFSVETIYTEKPLGYHQPSRWQAHKMAEIEEWCPEVKMLIGRRAT